MIVPKYRKKVLFGRLRVEVGKIVRQKHYEMVVAKAMKIKLVRRFIWGFMTIL
ncbi:MAG: hypothetical protein HGB32_03660 [Geobacteraceae bacterium]|nr:hypothetical protein [Geobacteraceae bacterium]NTW79227.1 hypothetical protein [Geobacteraceae bacterium]